MDHRIVVRSVHQSMVSQLPGRHLDEDVHDIPGSGLWKITYDLPTLVYTLHGVEHRTDLTVEHWLGQLRSSTGMLLMMMMTSCKGRGSRFDIRLIPVFNHEVS